VSAFLLAERHIDDFNAYESVNVYVCTNDTGIPDSGNVRYISGSAQGIINAVEKDGFQGLVICGGGKVNRFLASAGLVDEIVIGIQPVVLEEGIPLFGSYKPNLKLELISVTTGNTWSCPKSLRD
jgi:dihydrofolate reductase